MCAEDHNAKTDQIQGELVANTVLDAEPNTLLDEREVAKLLRISRYTVRNERLRGKIGYVQVGSKIFYDQSQVADYLRTADFHEASLLLADWVLNNVRPDKAAPEQVLIDNILLGYWNNHAKNLPSAKARWNGLAYWYEYWTGQTVAEITPNGQRLFREWLANKGSSDGGIDRILSVGRAALNRARKWQELREAPHIFAVQTAIMKRSRTPMGRPIVVTELAKMMDAARSRHMLIYLLVASNTLARPSAVLDLRRLQFDAGHKLIDLNPPGRLQNKKYRPIVPASSTLLPWLNSVETPQAYYVAYKRKAIKSIKQMWYITRDAAGLDSGLTPYSIRHGMARELRKRR